MAVISYRELPRVFEREVGKEPLLQRRLVATLSDDTVTGNATDAIPILQGVLATTAFGVPHPDLSGWKLKKVRVEEGYEGSPWHALVVADYGTIDPNSILVPTSRAADWAFEATGQDVPALYYYAGSGNGMMRPLTNSAFDYFQGLTTREQLTRATATLNYASFPTSQMSATNSVNNAAFFGGPAHCWLVEGVDAVLTREEFGGTVYEFWRTTIKLLYRQTGWNLQLPDVGFNILAGQQKRRAMVFDEQNLEWIPSANPVGLNGSGGQTFGAPSILVRRVYPETDFSSIFPVPP